MNERERFVADLRLLADLRKDYCRVCASGNEPKTANDLRDMMQQSEAEYSIHIEHMTAKWLADIMSGSNDGHGWCPSWRWPEWTERMAVPTPEQEAQRRVEELRAQGTEARVVLIDVETGQWLDE